jgi:tRNA threonylcarbamoyladenosine biosynthesis protein TsaB
MDANLNRILVMETAHDPLSVALGAAGQSWVRDVPGGAASSRGVLPAVAELLADAGLLLADLDVIAFGQGPGAFTGLRTACSVVQGLALGLGKPVLPLDTLMSVAEQVRALHPHAQRVLVVMDARMGEVYSAAYAWSDEAGDWTCVAAPTVQAPARVVLPSSWCDDGAPVWLSGNAAAALPDALVVASQCRGGRCDVAPHARALLTLGLRRFARSGGCDAAQAVPRYVRDKVAQTTAERAALIAR